MQLVVYQVVWGLVWNFTWPRRGTQSLPRAAGLMKVGKAL